MLVQAKNTKGFTLVELIVVITILAILATIGFLSLQGYTQDAKETKTVANLRTVASSLVNESAISGKSFTDYMTVDAAAVGFSGTVNSGTYVDLTNTGVYVKGDVNANALRIDGSKFFDTKVGATAPTPFKIAALTVDEQVGNKTRKRSMFQIAGTLKGTTGETALVEGTYAKGADTDLAGIVPSVVTTTKVVTAGTAEVPYSLK